METVISVYNLVLRGMYNHARIILPGRVLWAPNIQASPDNSLHTNNEYNANTHYTVIITKYTNAQIHIYEQTNK